MPYKFEREELVKLLIRAYNEGNCGFLDLSESVAEQLIEDCHEEIVPPQFIPYGTVNVSPHNLELTNSSFTTSPFVAHNNSRDSVSIDNLVVVNSNQEEAMSNLEIRKDEND